jgi:hypothetical protein
VKNQKVNAFYIIAFPVVLTIGILLIPVVSDYSNHDLASKAVQMTIRWFLGHIITAIAFCISLLSVSSIEKYLNRNSYHLPDFIKILMTIGAGLYAAGLGADGIGPIAVNITSSNPSLFFDGSGWWVSGTFMAATAFFGFGLISLVGHTNNAKMVRGVWRYITFISALLFVIVPAIPSGWGLFCEAIASFGVFLPLGLSVRRSV